MGMRLVRSVIALLFAASPALLGQKTSKAEVIWRDPGDISALNMTYGAGGLEHAPDPNGTFTFIKEDIEGTNPKLDVEDAAGVHWRVKLGEESQTETAATRLVWAAGYFVDEDYYLPEVTITNLPRLHRGREFVLPGGRIRGAGFERRSKDVKKHGDWDWFANPFRDTREENGLRVMMALLNNWDLKQVNNAIDEIDGERRYLVADLGATLGNTGNFFTRSKSVLKDYEQTPFIEHAGTDFVDFVLHTRPFALTIVNVHHYREYAGMEKLVKHIPRADAKWLGDRLSQLSSDQLGDGFRAAGYSTEQVTGYVRVIQQRIAALKAL